MTQPAPAVVTRYLAATESADLAACFTPDATVLDEGRTYRGPDEIVAWREAVAAAYTYTSDVTGTERIGQDEYRLTMHIEGDFPGGVADLAYRFRLRDGLIADLSITG